MLRCFLSDSDVSQMLFGGGFTMTEALQSLPGRINFSMLGEPPWRSICEVRITLLGLDWMFLLRDERRNDERSEAEPQLSEKYTPVRPAVRS